MTVTLSLSAFAVGYYHVIISDGQLASKLFHNERACWNLISARSLRAAAQTRFAPGNYISISNSEVNKATLKPCGKCKSQKEN